jgi:general secretion pathway protein L
MTRALPFSPQDVYFGWSPLGPAVSGGQVRQIIVKQSLLKPYIDALAAHGLPLTAVQAVGPEDQVCSTNMLDGSSLARRPLKWLNRTLLIASLLCVVLAGAATGLHLRQQELAGSQLAAEIASTKAIAAAVRKTIADADQTKAQIVGLRLRKADVVPVTVIWNEISKLLPDTAWLMELRVDEEIISLDGYAKSASELVGLFSQSRLLSNVSFASPVTRDQQSGMERFEIRAKARRSGGTLGSAAGGNTP